MTTMATKAERDAAAEELAKSAANAGGSTPVAPPTEPTAPDASKDQQAIAAAVAVGDSIELTDDAKLLLRGEPSPATSIYPDDGNNYAFDVKIGRLVRLPDSE